MLPLARGGDESKYQLVPQVLHQVDLTVEPGQRVAIVGASGSGKSTLGKLLLGLYAPSDGAIFYDAFPLQELRLQEVRRQFGVVLQESMLFSGSILSNITLSNPTLDVDRVTEAAKIAAIHDDVMAMPMGYDTFVSEGGSALSGGQRQRLAIARAVADKPKILLLDEATSHLDVETEQRVARNLRTLARTQIIIAHRLSTIRDADTILVLDHGAIVEGGTPGAHPSRWPLAKPRYRATRSRASTRRLRPANVVARDAPDFDGAAPTNNSRD